MLLGQAFAFIDIRSKRSSFLTTAKLDLVAYSGDAELYADTVNHAKVLLIVPDNRQPQVTISAVRIAGEDVLHYRKRRWPQKLCSFMSQSNPVCSEKQSSGRH
jgi:hypothetical protein